MAVFWVNSGTARFISPSSPSGRLQLYRGRLVAMYAMTIITSSAAPNQSHCELSASGSSSFISSSPSALDREALKGLSVSAHKKPAIVKADRDPAIIAALVNLADLTLQRRLGSPCESLSDQS